MDQENNNQNLKKPMVIMMGVLLVVGIIVAGLAWYEGRGSLDNGEVRVSEGEEGKVNVNTEVPETEVNEVKEGEGPIIVEPSEIDTSDWLTYRNEEYGFEFKYEEKYDLRDLTKPNQLTDKNLIKFIGVGSGSDLVFAVLISDTTLNKRLERILENEKKSYKSISSMKVTNFSTSSEIIDNHQATKIDISATYEDGRVLRQNIYLLEYNGYVYQFEVPSIGVFEEYFVNSPDILSTFKFIE